jgi:hypothetical protein
MLATTGRAGSILVGGAPWTRRGERQAEANVARASVIVGMLYRRLSTNDAAAANSAARIIEDNRAEVSWTIDPEIGTVTFDGLRRERVPWQTKPIDAEARLTVLPRHAVTSVDVELAQRLRQHGATAFAVPADANIDDSCAEDILVLRCPDRLGELDREIDGRLLRSRMARA